MSGLVDKDQQFAAAADTPEPMTGCKQNPSQLQPALKAVYDRVLTVDGWSAYQSPATALLLPNR